MRYTHRFEVDAPLDEVAAFHDRPASLRDLTPLVPMRILGEAPDELSPGDELTFRTWVGLVPVRWRARIEALPGATAGKGATPAAGGSATGIAGSELGGVPRVAGFVDRMVEGPFAAWSHTHRFIEVTRGRTAVEDEIEARLRPHPLWGPVSVQIWLTLPALFAYRGRKTRRLLGLTPPGSGGSGP